MSFIECTSVDSKLNLRNLLVSSFIQNFDLKEYDGSVFHSLDNLDGWGHVPRGQNSRDRKWNMNLNMTNLSLDTMFSLTEFRSLNMDEKHKAVMRLVPLLKPYICTMLEKLVGLDYTLGAANNQLDMGFDRPPRYESIHSK